MAKLKILSIDGGGSLNLISGWMLQRIQKERPGFLEQVDVFSGNSAGGIMALLLANSLNREDGLRQTMYLWSKVPVFSNTPVGTLGALVGRNAFFNDKALKGYLASILADKKLGQLNAKVVIPSFDLDARQEGQRNWKPKIFHNFGGEDEPDRAEKALDIALRTSAFPIFFPTHQGFVDGGLFANNPAMCALAQAMTDAPRGGGRSTDDIVMLSVGTGRESSYLPVDNADWGWQQWMFSPQHPLALIEAFYEAGMMAVAYQCLQILRQQFFRLNPFYGRMISLPEMFQDARSPRFAQFMADAEKMANSGRTAQSPEAPAVQENWLAEVLAWIDRVGWFEPAAPAEPAPPAKPPASTAPGKPASGKPAGGGAAKKKPAGRLPK